MSHGRALPSEKFNPHNPEHLKIIAERLNDFKLHLKFIRDVDFVMLDVPASASLFLWIGSAVSFTALLALNGIYYIGNQFLHYSHFEKPYQESLGQLIAAYRWYKNTPAPPGKLDETLSALEETIKQYVDKAYLPEEKPISSSVFSIFKTPEKKTTPPAEKPDLPNMLQDNIRFWRYGYNPDTTEGNFVSYLGKHAPKFGR